MKLLSHYREEVAERTSDVCLVFTDLDGTLLGRGGSLFASGDGRPSSAQARALCALHEAGLGLVPVSGRQIEHIQPVAWVLGASGFVAEVGTIVHVFDRSAKKTIERYLFGEFEKLPRTPSNTATPYQKILEEGILEFLFSRNDGRLEFHKPWHEGRRASHLLRGHVDVEAENAALQAQGFGWCRLVDNGVIPRKYESLDVEEVHAYHLLPRGCGKGHGVAEVLRILGLESARAVALGDGRADLEAAPQVAAVFLLRHALELDPSLADELSHFDNVYVTEKSYGEGWAEAISVVLGS
jgi:hydroxymethylpyrimidine pyrophosphatase-like HAD family hydrolase